MNTAHTKTQKKSLKVGKNAPTDAKNGSGGVKREREWTKMGPPGATFADVLSTFRHLGRSFTHFYAFL